MTMSKPLRPDQETACYEACRDVPRGIISMCPRSGKTLGDLLGGGGKGAFRDLLDGSR